MSAAAAMPTPWRVIESACYPWPIFILSATGHEVMLQQRRRVDSSQLTLTECMAGAHMGKDRAEAARLNELQLATLHRIVRCVNAHDALVAAANEVWTQARLLSGTSAAHCGGLLAAVRRLTAAVDAAQGGA